MHTQMTPNPQPNKRSKVRIALIAGGGLIALSVIGSALSKDKEADAQGAAATEDAAAVNQQLSVLASLLPTVAPSIYPSTGRLAMESWYFRYKSMTWVWLLYLASVIPLLMSVIYHWSWARKTGMALFVIAFLAQTASVAIRWYISGRWPNANMFGYDET